MFELINGIREITSAHEIVFSLLDQLLPSWALKSVLKCRHTLGVRKTKHFSVDRVVCHSKLSSIISVKDMQNLDSVSEDWK